MRKRTQNVSEAREAKKERGIEKGQSEQRQEKCESESESERKSQKEKQRGAAGDLKLKNRNIEL